MIEGVGEDSGEPEWWIAGVGGGCVEWGIGKRRRYWPGGWMDLQIYSTLPSAHPKKSWWGLENPPSSIRESPLERG